MGTDKIKEQYFLLLESFLESFHGDVVGYKMSHADYENVIWRVQCKKGSPGASIAKKFNIKHVCYSPSDKQEQQCCVDLVTEIFNKYGVPLLKWGESIFNE